MKREKVLFSFEKMLISIFVLYIGWLENLFQIRQPAIHSQSSPFLKFFSFSQPPSPFHAQRAEAQGVAGKNKFVSI